MQNGHMAKKIFSIYTPVILVVSLVNIASNDARNRQNLKFQSVKSNKIYLKFDLNEHFFGKFLKKCNCKIWIS